MNTHLQQEILVKFLAKLSQFQWEFWQKNEQIKSLNISQKNPDKSKCLAVFSTYGFHDRSPAILFPNSSKAFRSFWSFAEFVLSSSPIKRQASDMLAQGFS